ncbi:MAG: phosphoribosylamine--glycine ligase [Deltaproteobacteria bacterium]|nr:phosphoribosylamine--glycine ligase [Deltaproteobacteria bacterium]
MKILVTGSGGREHALVWKIAQSPKVEKIYCAPGNGGIEALAECVPIGAEEIDQLLAFARKKEIDLTVTGPEAPLTHGIVNRFEEAGLPIFGPRKEAAILEGSKKFTKDFLKRHHIPTAAYACFQDAQAAIDYIHQQGIPIVVKADGLAAGKGVFVAQNEEEAIAAVRTVMEDKKFGDAGETLVVEECLVGEEASFMVFSDGKTVVPMVSSQDHKQIFDGDTGPNTGGMGAYSPAPVIQGRTSEIMENIMIPTIRGMEEEGRPFRGVLYAGLMMTDTGPQVLEFNVRFGDPEAQPILFRLKTDLIEIMEAIGKKRLHECRIEWSNDSTACVVLASDGYPGTYEKGKVITGLSDLPDSSDLFVFHAGTERAGERILTAGGRVLSVTASGQDLPAALGRAYDTVHRIDFPGKYFRTDIGRKGLDRQTD